MRRRVVGLGGRRKPCGLKLYFKRAMKGYSKAPQAQAISGLVPLPAGLTHRKTTMKFRICSHCKKRTPHHDQAGALRCSQCVQTPRQPTKNLGGDRATGLRAALKLWVTYPHPANCFFVYALQACLKICLFFWLLFGVFERGFFTSALMLIVGVFAINCFGPRGREKTVAVAFGKQFWTTLVPR